MSARFVGTLAAAANLDIPAAVLFQLVQRPRGVHLWLLQVPGRRVDHLPPRCCCCALPRLPGQMQRRHSAGWHGIDCAHRTASNTDQAPGLEQARPWIADNIHTPAAQHFAANDTRRRPLIYVCVACDNGTASDPACSIQPGSLACLQL